MTNEGESLDDSIGQFQCGVCKARYSRSDHLIRHVRVHTRLRPFACSVCSKTFARQDLLKRHCHNAHAAGHATRYAARVQQACRACASKKLKCTDVKPCPRCTAKSIPCEFEPLLDLDPAAEDASALPTEHLQVLYDPPNTSPDSNLALDNALAVDPAPDPGGHLAPHGEVSPLDDIWGCTLDLPSFGEYLDLDSNALLDDFTFEERPMASALAAPTRYQADNSQPPVMGIGSGAYMYVDTDVRKSWYPLPAAVQGQTSLELRSNVRPESLSVLPAPHPEFTMFMRDRLLLMLSQTSAFISGPKIGNFPGVDVLTEILHHACSHLRTHQQLNFIHLTAFDLDRERPELAGALIAYGAVNCGSESVRTFGYVLHDLLRVAINQRFAIEPAATRELGLAQAYYLIIYLGYWSAISAKIEIAERDATPTLLRRSRLFEAVSYQTPDEILAEDPSLSLNARWRKWISQESKKRLVYFGMILDANVSIARRTSPTISYAEVATPLPAPLRLWNAATAEQWHEILVSDDELRTKLAPSVCRILRQPGVIHAQRRLVDIRVAGAAKVAGCWGLVNDYHQMYLLRSRSEDWNHDFVLKSRYTELSDLLEQLKLEFAELTNSPVELMLLQALVSLHLNVAYFDLAAYCGRGTVEDARAAKPYVSEWITSDSARLAVFYAGQVFRFARMLPPGSLTDMWALALFQATETLWIYGLMQLSNKHDLADAVQVCLDRDDDDASVGRFLKHSRGNPGLTGLDQRFLPLVEAASVSDLANDIIKENLGPELYSLTTGEVSRVVQGFSKIGRERFG